MTEKKFRVVTESHGEVTIEARGKKGTYHVSFYYKGKHVRRSLKTSNRQRAEENLPATLNRLQRSETSETNDVQAIQPGQIAPPVAVGMRLEEGLAFYLRSLLTKDCPRTTLNQAETRIKAFIDHVTVKGVTHFHQVEGIHADTFFQSTKKGRHTNTSVGYFRFVKAMFRYLKSRQLISSNPFIEISFARVDCEKTPKPILSELNQILENVEPRYLVPLTALAFLGCRAEALTRIKTKHVDLEKGTIFIERPVSISTKTIQRLVPIHPRLLALLKTYKRPRSSYYFCTLLSARSKGGRKMKMEYLNLAFQRAAREAEFPVGRAEQGFVAHSLRGFFKSHTTLICGIPREVVDIWQGHREDNRVGTRHYIDMTIEQLIEFMKKVDFGT